ncbi:hypothetical protein [Mesorhizobium sp. 128a]
MIAAFLGGKDTVDPVGIVIVHLQQGVDPERGHRRSACSKAISAICMWPSTHQADAPVDQVEIPADASLNI